MHITNLESSTFTREATRAESRQASPVSDRCERVRLIHELAQLGCPEELLDRCNHRPDVDQSLRCDRFRILCGHTLADHTLEACQPDADLILNQLPDCTNTTVLEVVDVIDPESLGTLVEAHQVLDRCDHVLVGDQALLGSFEVVEHLDRRIATELLVELVATHACEVVPFRSSEERLDEAASRLDRGEFPRTELAIEVEESLVLRRCRVLLECVAHELGVAEQRDDFLIGFRNTERTQECGHELATFTIDTHADRFLLVDIELEPRTAARYHLARVCWPSGGLVTSLVEVHTRAAHKLAHNDTLSAVDDERAIARHHREVAKEHLLFLDLTRFLVEEPGSHIQRTCIVGVTILRVLNRKRGIIEPMVGQF